MHQQLIKRLYCIKMINRLEDLIHLMRINDKIMPNIVVLYSQIINSYLNRTETISIAQIHVNRIDWQGRYLVINIEVACTHSILKV